MGAGASLDRRGLAALGVLEVADLVSESWLPEYRQASIDFGIDGDMLTRLPRDQLADALRRAGVESNDDLEFLLGELDNIRSPMIDSGKLDRENLRELLPQLDKQSSYDLDEGTDTSDWSGVSVNKHDRITALNVANRGLSGELPASLGDVSYLEHLHATSNCFAGCIPEAIGRLTCLKSLRLDHNNFSGRLPGSLTRLSSLATLDLAWNGLEGTIPTKIGTMTALRKLSLGKNKLNGAIPREMGALHFLVELRLRENKLVGKIPPLLSNMCSLQVLDLTSNLLQGHIPESLGGMTELRQLWLGGNQLVGGIPEALSRLTDLQSLDLSRNKLGATLPWRLFIGLSSSLVYLDLSRNAFEGETHLAALSPYSREMALTEPRSDDVRISDDDSGATNWAAQTASSSPLSYLNLSRNQFTGRIPEAIGGLTSLNTLDLSWNKLEGHVPSDLGGCRELRVLSLSCCGLSGHLDGSDGGGAPVNNGGGLGRLALLESLRLDGNLFEGSVPAALGNLTRLEVLQLQSNCFSGCLPNTLGQLGRLWTLGVRDNELSGRVPESLGHLTGLRSLRLEGNPSLRGPIPEPLASRSDCAVTADDSVLEDTEATKLGARLGDWFLMTRKVKTAAAVHREEGRYQLLVLEGREEAFLNLRDFPGFASARPSIVRYVSTVVPYECHVFAAVRGRRLFVRQKEIAFFSHCWDLPPEQCPPRRSILEGPHMDTPNINKVRHMQACLKDAPPSIQYIWLDMLCVPLAEPKSRRAAGRTVPFFVQNSGRVYIFVDDSSGLQRYKSRAWCRLEALCAACPHQPSQVESAFSPKPPHDSAKARFVYDSVECFLSTWNKGTRDEARLDWEELSAAGFMKDPVEGKLSDQNDRRDVAEAALGAINAMELSGRMDPDVATPMRFSCKKTLYGSQGWEGEREDEEEILSIRPDKIRRGSTRLKQFRRVRSVATPTSSSVATSDQLTLLSSQTATG